MSTVRALATMLAVWVLYQVLVPYVPAATVFFPVVAYALWRGHQHALAVVTLLGGSLLLDLTLPGGTPQYLLVSAVAGAAYLELVDHYLSSATTLGSTVGLMTWLLIFRLSYLTYLAASGLLLHQPLPSLTLAFSLGWRWFATALITWAVIQLALYSQGWLARRRKSKLVSYA